MRYIGKIGGLLSIGIIGICSRYEAEIQIITDSVAILQQPHQATPFLQQGTIVNDTMKQLTKIFSPPNRSETAMAAPSTRVL
jgi:hypothetical protein